MNITIEAIHVTRTYGGVLEGMPTIEASLASARAQAERLWGERPTYLIEPTPESINFPSRFPVPRRMPKERLPQWTLFAWLHGPALKDGCGSELVVIWFAGTPQFELLPHDLLKPGEWEDHAKDWEA